MKRTRDENFFVFSHVQKMERFHSRDQQPHWITETKESICIKLEFNSRRNFFVLEHQHGRRDVMIKMLFKDLDVRNIHNNRQTT